jgi:hypothetical protein
MNAEWVILGGGSRRIKIKIKPEVLLKLGAEVITDLAVTPQSGDQVNSRNKTLE